MIRSVALFVLALVLAACDGATPSSTEPSAANDDDMASPATEVASDNPELCTLGLKVLTPGGKLGTVTNVEGGGCTVTVDETGLSNVWAEFMLKPAPGTTSPMEQHPGAPQAGWYYCNGGAAGNFRVEIRSANTYANSDGNEGSYTFDPATLDITWTSGPWTEFYSRVLKDGDIGVTMKPDRSFFSFTCEREG